MGPDIGRWRDCAVEHWLPGYTHSQLDVAMISIAGQARDRNAERGITVALVFTGTRFAHFLEGLVEAVDEIMFSITRDTRPRA